MTDLVPYFWWTCFVLGFDEFSGRSESDMWTRSKIRSFRQNKTPWKELILWINQACKMPTVSPPLFPGRLYLLCFSDVCTLRRAGRMSCQWGGFSISWIRLSFEEQIPLSLLPSFPWGPRGLIKKAGPGERVEESASRCGIWVSQPGFIWTPFTLPGPHLDGEGSGDGSDQVSNANPLSHGPRKKLCTGTRAWLGRIFS